MCFFTQYSLPGNVYGLERDVFASPGLSGRAIPLLSHQIAASSRFHRDSSQRQKAKDEIDSGLAPFAMTKGSDIAVPGLVLSTQYYLTKVKVPC